MIRGASDAGPGDASLGGDSEVDGETDAQATADGKVGDGSMDAALCGDVTAPDPYSTSIAGTWNFTPTGGSQMQIQVPGGGWEKQGVTASSGTYATQITIPDSGAPQTTLLDFGAVNFQATLTIDGNMVGTNTTSFTPSIFDITQHAAPGTHHSISVFVKGRGALTGHQSCTGNTLYEVPIAADWTPNVAAGIFRSATLDVYPDVYISDAFVQTSVSNDTLTYQVSVRNTGTASQQVTLSGWLNSWNCQAFQYPTIPDTTVQAAAGMTTTVTVGPIQWGLGSTSFWWPNVPYQENYSTVLHNLNLQLSRNNQVVHSKVVRFGFRDIMRKQADSSHVYYYLNGVRVNFRGDNLQGADYDNINYGGGKGDAYDTWPGFLAPSAQNPGWPQAIANYQKLNYNFVRIHQVLAAPYMLDTADELGLMLMGETAIRGSSGDQDFIGGHDNMVGHVQAMVQRDRNHPAIVRWSQSNEPNLDCTDSEQFETDLFNAVEAVDTTRPVSVDAIGDETYTEITSINFATVGHYLSGLGAFSTIVQTIPQYPYGQGEFIWPKDETAQGLAWFATATAAMRAEDASDVRPYALLSGWSSVIPGVTTSAMEIEQGFDGNGNPNPLFGEDNLPDPWSNPIIERIQHGFNPVLVADQQYWQTNEMSDANGDWPTAVPTVSAGSTAMRTLLVFNDTFSGTTVDVTWEFHAGSATGTIASSGTLNLTVPLGSMVTQTVNVTAPSSGTTGFLVLRAQKNGVTLFEEDNEAFNLN
jgi:hypothetical protein